MAYYKVDNSSQIYTSLEMARKNAIRIAENYLKGTPYSKGTREYIALLEKKGPGLKERKALGYVSVMNGHYIWVTGRSRKDYRVLDRSGRIMRTLTKSDYDYIM